MKNKNYSISATKRRAAVNFILFFIGIAVIAAVYAVFRKTAGAATGGMISASAESYSLFFSLSLAASAVFMILVLLSRVLASVVCGDGNRFGKLIASVSPTVCQILILLISIFYAYITSGGSVNTAPYVLLTGLGEALIFTLPAALSSLCGLYGNKKK